ncbi:MAG: VCBS repeat-containing protein, partial [Saprospiraceae bacterium]|nr:VCBS repeat-containing protein [Saprospiraceae bacterium]
MTDRILLLLGLLIACLLPSEDMYAQWKYIQIDSTKQKWGDWAEPNWLRYFGLDAGDVDRDGCIDIVSGRYLYRNPCADMEAHWERQSLDDNVDAILMINIDDDPYADIIAQALPDLYWFEAIDQEASAFTRRKIATVPATSHVNSQGFVKGDLDSDEREEIVIAGNGNIYAIKIPNDPHTQDWPTSLICANTSDEGIGIGDINGDGHLDIAAGRRPEGEGEPTILTWFRNPGNLTAVWVDQVVGGTDHPIDRIKIGDINGDKKPDIIVTEERYPGLEPDAHLYWFAQPNGEGPWERHTIVQQYSMNNLDATDMDRDGDLDVLTNEHKGTKLALQWWINDGQGTFIKRTIDTGKENHLGTQLVDLDRDGDLDIIGAGWDQYRFMHVWRNDKNTTQVLPKTKTTSGFGIGPIRQTMYEGRPHYLIKTATLTYYYDINGGGLSRIIDPKGNDWIGYRTTPSEDYPAAAAGAFRGVPNAVFQSDDGGAGHPG